MNLILSYRLKKWCHVASRMNYKKSSSNEDHLNQDMSTIKITRVTLAKQLTSIYFGLALKTRMTTTTWLMLVPHPMIDTILKEQIIEK